MILKELREQKKISQKELADLVNASQSVICLYETGRRKIPVDRAKQLAAYFDVPWPLFYEDSPEASPDVP